MSFVPQADHPNYSRYRDVKRNMWSHTFTVCRNAHTRSVKMLHKTQNRARFDPKCWYNVRKVNQDNLTYVFCVVFCVFVAFQSFLVWGCQFQGTENATKSQNTTLKAYGKHLYTFGIKRCKILCFMKYSYQSLESSRVRALRNTVNVWDHMSRVTSRSHEQFGCSSYVCTKFSSYKTRVCSFGMIRIRVSDPRSLGSWPIKWTDESMSRVDSSVHLIYHDPNDLRSLILIRIIPKERTLLAILELRREVRRVSNSKQSINWHHHIKVLVEFGFFNKFGALKLNRDQVMTLKTWFSKDPYKPQ